MNPNQTPKHMDTISKIEVTNESGEIILCECFKYESAAQSEFDRVEQVYWPHKHKNLCMNLSEYPEGRVGSVRLVVENQKTGERFLRRELYRHP